MSAAHPPKSDLHALLNRLRTGELRFRFIVFIELFLVFAVATYLYVFDIHLNYALKASRSTAALTAQERLSTALQKKQREQIAVIEGWWRDHVVPASDLPRILEALAPANASPVSSLSLGTLDDKGDYRIASISASFQGSFSQLLEWMNHIETLPFFIRIAHVDLKPSSDPLLATASPPLVGEVLFHANVQ